MQFAKLFMHETLYSMWSGCGRMGLWYKQVSDSDTLGTLHMHSPFLMSKSMHREIRKKSSIWSLAYIVTIEVM